MFGKIFEYILQDSIISTNEHVYIRTYIGRSLFICSSVIGISGWLENVAFMLNYLYIGLKFWWDWPRFWQISYILSK